MAEEEETVDIKDSALARMLVVALEVIDRHGLSTELNEELDKRYPHSYIKTLTQ